MGSVGIVYIYIYTPSWAVGNRNLGTSEADLFHGTITGTSSPYFEDKPSWQWIHATEHAGSVSLLWVQPIDCIVYSAPLLKIMIGLPNSLGMGPSTALVMQFESAAVVLKWAMKASAPLSAQ